jgi:hypothetical protein
LNGGNTLSGTQTMTGQLQLTGQTLVDANSGLTRGLADARYGGPVYYSSLANNVPYTSDATGTVILSVLLPPGTYLIDVFVKFIGNGANSRTTANSTGSPTWSGFRGTCSNAGSPVRIYGTNQGLGGTPWTYSTNVDNHERGGMLVTATDIVLTVTAAQNTSSATTTTAAAGSYLVARKIA